VIAKRSEEEGAMDLTLFSLQSITIVFEKKIERERKVRLELVAESLSCMEKNWRDFIAGAR
jgi:hypothetical protein